GGGERPDVGEKEVVRMSEARYPREPVGGQVDGRIPWEVGDREAEERPQHHVPELLDRQRVRPGEATNLLERRVHGEENGKEDEHREAAADRVDAPLLVELHLLLLKLLAIVPVLLLDVVHRGSELLHRARRANLRAEDREKRETDRHRDDHDRESEVVDEVIGEDEQVDERIAEARVPQLGAYRWH